MNIPNENQSMRTVQNDQSQELFARNLMKPSSVRNTEYITEIHNQALSTSKAYIKCEKEFLSVLQTVEREKVYLHFKYNSLFSYATNALKLSDDVALNFINVARKATQVPELKEAILNTDLSVSKARKIVPVLNNENKDHWITLAQTLPQKLLEKEVARVSPKTLTPEKTKYVTGDRLMLQLGVSETLMNKLKAIKDLLIQKYKKAASFEEALEAMADLYLEKNDPILKAKRSQNRDEKQIVKKVQKQVTGEKQGVSQTQVTSQMQLTIQAQIKDKRQTSEQIKSPVARQVIQKVNQSPQKSMERRPFTAKIKHEVILRYSGQCAGQDHNNKRCTEKRWLQIHHIKPVAQGGDNSLSNLTLLCWGHHKMEHLV